MTKQELERMFNEEYNAIHGNAYNENQKQCIKDFIFKKVIPEVLKSIKEDESLIDPSNLCYDGEMILRYEAERFPGTNL